MKTVFDSLFFFGVLTLVTACGGAESNSQLSSGGVSSVEASLSCTNGMELEKIVTKTCYSTVGEDGGSECVVSKHFQATFTNEDAIKKIQPYAEGSPAISEALTFGFSDTTGDDGTLRAFCPSRYASLYLEQVNHDAFKLIVKKPNPEGEDFIYDYIFHSCEER